MDTNTQILPECSDTNMSSGNRYYDKHTLYVKSGVAYNHQLKNSMIYALEELGQRLGKKVECNFKVNLIVGRNGKYYGFGYMWVSNPEVYNMLVGKNPDGTDRVEYIDDPTWTPPDSSYEEAVKSYNNSTSTSWADIADEEECLNKTYTCPKIRKDLAPLLVLPGYDYEEDQLIYIKQLEPETTEMPTKGYFHISPAFVQDLEDKYCHNVLCCRNVPSWITEKDLKAVFTPYASNSITKVKRKFKNKEIKDTYPFVTINDNRVAFITFDPSTKDAQFALLMMRKVDLVSPFDTSQTCTLVFNHSYNTSQRS